MKTLSRRFLLATAALAAFVAAPFLPARAADDDYPSRPVTMVVPVAPGGIVDFTGRLLAEGMTRELGKQFVVENKGGASGNIGIQQVARAEPDGYTLLVAYSGYQVTNPTLFKKLQWDPIRDFAPVGLAIKAPHVVVARKDLPVNTLGELVTYAKANPGKLNYASPGNGSIPHIGGEQLKQMTGIEMEHIAYKGTGPAMIDILGGTIDLLITTPPSAAGHLREQAVKGLGLAAGTRHPMLPDIPTSAEFGRSGLRARGLDGHLRARRHPSAHHRQAGRSDGAGGEERSVPEERPGAGDLRRPHGPEGACRPHRVPDHLLGRGDQEGQHLARLIGCCASGRVTSRGGVRWRRSTWRRS